MSWAPHGETQTTYVVLTEFDEEFDDNDDDDDDDDVDDDDEGEDSKSISLDSIGA